MEVTFRGRAHEAPGLEVLLGGVGLPFEQRVYARQLRNDFIQVSPLTV